MNTSIDVALILWNSDVIDLMSFVLLDRHLTSSGIEPSAGVKAMENLIVSYSPSVVVFDLNPPYDRSAAIVLHLMSCFPDRCFVITCADRKLAVKMAPWLRSHRIFQKPYETGEIADTVKTMVTHLPSSFASLAVGM